MNHIIVFYNPYLPELKISVNGKKISPYSALMSFQHQRLEKWCNSLFSELYREVNSDYEVLCISNDFSCDWLNELAQRNPHCLSFTSQPLPLDSNVYERLGKLELLGCEEESNSIVIPVLNASEDDRMTDAVYEILEEQGVFENISPEGAAWYDCPLVNIELVTCNSSYDLPYDIPFAIVLCSNEDDYISIDTDVPVYALVMGTETRFIRRQGGKLLFSVDPDDIGSVILNILEEEALCPLLSQMSYQFPSEAAALLTDSEKEELALVCHAAPICNVTIPKVCDLGRKVMLDIQVIPQNTDTQIRLVSDEPTILGVTDDTLVPYAPGTAEVAVFIGSDPYPVASEIIKVRHRNLITGITLFPSTLYMPEEGSSRLDVTVTPADAENVDEIFWESSDPSIAIVDAQTGIISANSCGRCKITAYTQEASTSIWMEVQPAIEDIILPGSYVELGVGEQKEWRYKVLPENAYGADTLRIVSSNKNVADYRGGYAVGKSIGECKIYIKSPNSNIGRELRVAVRKGRRSW